jgi:N-terminal domain of anti-restriction factor ArdC
VTRPTGSPPGHFGAADRRPSARSWSPASDRQARGEQRRQRVAAAHEQLTEGVARLVEGEQWRAMLAAAARSHDYSWRNVVLILAQRSEARRVAGYRTWQRLGSQVRKGEKGIGVIAPVTYRPAEFIQHPGHPVPLDVGDSGPVDPGRAAVAAHLNPRALQNVPAIDLVVERVEPSPGISLGRPVQRSLQSLDTVLLGGPSHEGTHPPFPAPKRIDEAAALSSPAVMLSARLNRYYGRLRRPPGPPPTSRGHRL